MKNHSLDLAVSVNDQGDIVLTKFIPYNTVLKKADAEKLADWILDQTSKSTPDAGDNTNIDVVP